MTTIAYDGYSICYDGRETFNGMICADDKEKLYRCKHGKMFMAGSTCAIERFINEFEDGKDTNVSEEVLGFLIETKFVYLVGVSQGKFWKCKQSGQKIAIGSGAPYAISAMDHGKSAYDAVYYAMTRDIYSGGDVTHYFVETEKLEVTPRNG